MSLVKHWCCNSSTIEHRPNCTATNKGWLIACQGTPQVEPGGYAPRTKPVMGQHLPTDAKERKRIPLYSGLMKYFPDALVDVARLSYIGNEQHNPGEPLHWAREKSTDQEDTAMRHLLEGGSVDTDGVRHTTKAVWRLLAKLQLEIEAARKG